MKESGVHPLTFVFLTSWDATRWKTSLIAVPFTALDAQAVVVDISFEYYKLLYLEHGHDGNGSRVG